MNGDSKSQGVQGGKYVAFLFETFPYTFKGSHIRICNMQIICK